MSVLCLENENIRKFSVNRIPVRLRVTPDNPVVLGVIDALGEASNVLGAVSSVTIWPNSIYMEMDEARGFCLGSCHSKGRGTSGETGAKSVEINIFAGSIHNVVSGPLTTIDPEEREKAKMVTKHELGGHGRLMEEMHSGIWLSERLNRDEREEIADKYAFSDRCLEI